MACAAVGTVRDAILEALRERQMDAFELLEFLGKRYSDSEIKQGMAEMLGDGTIALSNQRILRLGRQHAA